MSFDDLFEFFSVHVEQHGAKSAYRRRLRAVRVIWRVPRTTTWVVDDGARFWYIGDMRTSVRAGIGKLMIVMREAAKAGVLRWWCSFIADDAGVSLDFIGCRHVRWGAGMIREESAVCGGPPSCTSEWCALIAKCREVKPPVNRVPFRLERRILLHTVFAVRVNCILLPTLCDNIFIIP